MSIELKEAAQQALKELGEARKIVRASSSRQLAKDWDRRATDALANLRAAIQQAEAQQPATGEPLGEPFGWWFTEDPDVFCMPGSGFRRFPNKPAHTAECLALYTHPAPSVPADVVRDAERYRWLRDPKNHAQIGVGQWTDDGFGWRYSDEADAAIDAAMLAAKEGTNGEIN